MFLEDLTNVKMFVKYVEIVRIIKSLKNNKAPGEDNINDELIKTANRKLISKIWFLIKEI